MQNDILPALAFEPPSINFNFDELKKRIADITEKYTGLVVGVDDVVAIKSEMAGLNKLADHLAAARKEAVEKVSAPIKAFETQVKEVEGSIKETRAFLDEQVKAHIQREKDGKKQIVTTIIEALKDEYGCPGLDIPVQENWLNKTASDKLINNEILAIILNHKKQEEEKAALEQAKKDRLLAIENHSKALAQGRNYALPLANFINLQALDVPLAVALQKIEQAYQQEDSRREVLQQPKPEPVKTAPAHFTDFEAPKSEPVKKEPVKAMTISATYQAQHGPEIQMLYAQIKKLCLTCTASVKELEHA